MRLRLPAKAADVQEFLALAIKMNTGPGIPIVPLKVSILHEGPSRDYTGDSNDDATDWLVVGA